MRKGFSTPRAAGLVLLVLGVMLLSACGAATEAPPPSPTPIPDDPTRPNLDVRNNTPAAVCFIYLVPTNHPNDWGLDQLGSDNVVLPDGGMATLIDIEPGDYDIKTEDCEHNVLSWYYIQTIGVDSVFTVEPVSDQIIVQNNGTSNICAIWLWDPTGGIWHRAQVNDSTTPVTPGTSRTIAASAMTWNMRIDTCDGASEEFSVPVSGPTTFVYPPQ